MELRPLRGLLPSAFVVLIAIILFTVLPTVVTAENFTWPTNMTDADTNVTNGLGASNAGTENDMSFGSLKLRYTKTNGDSTTAQSEGTQSALITQDTVIKIIGDSISIVAFSDVNNRTGATLGGTYYADQTVNDGPESADTSTSHPAFIGKNDTAIFIINIRNTGNGSETFVFHINNWDTSPAVHGDPNVARTAQSTEGAAGVISGFEVSLANGADMSDSLNSPIGSVLTGVGSYPVDITWGNSNFVAEGAETTVLLRVASLGTANARDTIGLTLWAYADSHGAAYTAGQFVRISDDSGYLGDNDTQYAQGSSQDSVSVFVTIATAVVRLRKSDSVYAPIGYQNVTTGAGTSDVIPGATIVYNIVYDNDGNQHADTIQIIDILPANVDLKIDSYINGVDTALVHTRGRFNGADWDTGVVVNFSSRGDSVNFLDTSTIAFSNTAYNGKVCDTVAGIKIHFVDRTSGRAYPGASLDIDNFGAGNQGFDTTGDVNWPTAEGTVAGDSGDVGLIRFAVVIR